MNTNSEKPKVGLAKFAYRGAPKGVSHIQLEDVDMSPKPSQWNFKTKKVRKAEFLETL